MAKWSVLDYTAPEINNLLVTAILKMLSQTDAPKGGTLSQIWVMSSTSELLYLANSPYLTQTYWRKKMTQTFLS